MGRVTRLLDSKIVRQNKTKKTKIKNQMKANNPTSTSRGVKWAAALSAIAISLIADTASAKDEVPAKGTQTSQIISSHTNDDDSVDTISLVVGVSSQSGRVTAVQYTHVLAPVYDPASNSLIYSFTFTSTGTAANGDQWDTEGEGKEIVPLDSNFVPLPPPWAFSGTYQPPNGSTFHGTFQGLDFADGSNWVTWAGTTLSRGAQKK